MSYVFPVNQLIASAAGLSIHEMLEIRAERTPDAIAIAAPGRTPLTYGRLRIHMDHVMQALNAMGLGRSDRVALVLPNGPEMAVAFTAVAASATCAPLNPAYQTNEFDFYLSDLNAKALIIQSGIDSPAVAVAQKHGISIIECSPVLEAEAGIFTLSGDERACLVGTNGHPLLSGFAQPDDVALMLHTSGTTARPKLVPLTHTNICTAAHDMQVALELTAADRCLSVMPLFHIHGLIGATLLPLAAGASVVCTPGFDVTAFFEWLEEFRPTWYTAVPTMHQAILTRAEGNREIIARCPLRFIRSCSAALPPRVVAELETVFQAPVIDSYGMTEASHQMACNPLPPGVRKAGSVGVAAGPEVAVMDNIGNLLPPGQKGELVVRGANVTQGYENNPTANQSAFTNGWFRTGDQGYLDADRYIFITGRLKEVINRGGEKISPREVDEVLLEHPAIGQVVTFAAPHALLGEEVAAGVVLRENTSATERDIQEFASARLADFKVPRRVIFLKEIPKGPTGKLQRMGLAEKLGLTPPDSACPKRERPCVAPRDTLELQLTQIWEKVLAIRPIGIRDNFFDLGGYSLLAARLFGEIEKVTGKNLPLATLLQAPTIEHLAELLRQEGWSAPWAPLVALQSGGSNPPFFFMHAVGGNILNYRDLSRCLGPDQPFYGLQAQGLDGKQAPHTRVEDMAALYIKEIRTVQSEGPYFLGGGSSGGIVAFEMAQQLQAQGQQVALLALFDPYQRSLTTFLRDRRSLPKPAAFRSKTYSLVQRVDQHLGQLLLCGPKDYVAGRVGKLKTRIERKFQEITYKGSPYTDGSSSRALHVVLEANRQALSTYVPQVYPGQITLFLCSEAPERFFYDSRWGWNEMAAEGLEVHVIPGSHETVFSEPHVKVAAEKLRVCLQKVRRRF
jgi:acyl-CoA synthetase (AMP-forming)/AMP-acid ligase II/thioesterase domain-containing protein